MFSEIYLRLKLKAVLKSTEHWLTNNFFRKEQQKL